MITEQIVGKNEERRTDGRSVGRRVLWRRRQQATENDGGRRMKWHDDDDNDNQSAPQQPHDLVFASFHRD